MLMSFIDCIGHLMKGSGLEKIQSVAYGGVRNMLNGKAWPKAVRGLRMVAVAILDGSINCGATRVEAFVDELQKASQSPTGRMWIDCLIMPVVTSPQSNLRKATSQRPHWLQCNANFTLKSVPSLQRKPPLSNTPITQPTHH